MRFRSQLAISALACLAACGGSDGGTTSPGTNPGTNPGTGGNPGTTTPVQTTSVQISNNLFSPKDIQVAPGTTVTWTWSSGSDSHNVTFADGPSSGDKVAGASYSRTFSATGTFTYQCTLHPGMNGSVLVK